MIFRSRKERSNDQPSGATATAIRDLESLNAEIASIQAELHGRDDSELERRLLHLRHLAGLQLLDAAIPVEDLVEPDPSRLSDGDVPEIELDRLSAGAVRAAILDRGCALVRGLLPREDALAIAEEIELALQAWEAAQEGGDVDPGLFEEFVAERSDVAPAREWVNSGGGIWTADSPRLMCRVIDVFERTGLKRLADDYLREPSLLSVQKGTLRKVPPTAGRGWHQDGAFLGDVKALNTWIALSRAGDESPGMDLIPKRLDRIVETGTEGAIFEWSVSEQVAERTAGDTPIVRPIFEPGDMLLFDEMFLHTTAAEPTMPNHRYAIETWFFGRSAFPPEYAPIRP